MLLILNANARTNSLTLLDAGGYSTSKSPHLIGLMSLFNNKIFTFTKRNLLQLPMGLTCPEMHYFLFNLSPKNHLRSTLFSLLNYFWCIYLVDPLTLAGTTAHPSIACDSLIFYVICRGPSYSFASKITLGLNII